MSESNSMGHCWNCRHWEVQDWTPREVLGYCERLTHEREKFRLENDVAGAVDTAPDFGCVLHEPDQRQT